MGGTETKDRPEGVLESIGIFSGLGPDDLALVFGRMKRRECPAGETLFVEGSAGDELFVVLSGSVGISLTLHDGKDLTISRVPSGGFFGEMSLIERAPRSATCRIIEDSVLLSLHARDFDLLVREKPGAAARVMQRMLAITTGRLLATSSFLSQMVQWGESARRRAVTDEATGLFNRRFLDDSLQGIFERSVIDNAPLSVAMFDLDHFGDLNKAHGMAFGDLVILEASKAFRRVFRERDILVRYGGDEFTFVLPGTGPAEALGICENVCKEIRSLTFPGREGLTVSASLGVASLPEHARSLDALTAAADRALYHAKELGRDRAALPPPPAPSLGGERGAIKKELRSLAEKNRIIGNILAALEQRDGLLLLGHRNPDEDCIASMVAFGLLAGKLNKTVYLVTGGALHEQFSYLLSICTYNSIHLSADGSDLPGPVQAVIALDTPKPSMLEDSPAIRALVGDESVLKIEIDHHLEADSTYFGDHGYNLVTGASSASELVGLLAFKMDLAAEYKARHQIDEVFSRNFVLAVLTGMIGDSRMGKYLKTRKERWYYEWFSALFDRMLSQKTHRNSANFTSKEEVFKAIASLSGDEEECFRYMHRKRSGSENLRFVILDAAESSFLYETYGNDIVSSVSKAVADTLAEESGCLGMVAYPDDPALSNFVQFRLRRAQGFQSLDLRDILSRYSFLNGGGHPGAVGFRFDRAEVPDLAAFAADIVRKIEDVVRDAQGDGAP
ncbi:MAG: diguanylate cyclase [Spirochaetes bacterium]|nr:diguanylate cyclase [Spirochaetota bacterium]